MKDGPTALRRAAEHWIGSFEAMANRCEVLMEVDDRQDAARILSIVSSEACRIERKFSRYLSDSVTEAINRSDGRWFDVDEETARLLDFSQQLYNLSDGTFDITSGVLRKVWNFDGGDQVPTAEAVRAVLENVGWDRVEWRAGRLRLPAGMQIDFGGVGKEFAVDRAARLASEACPKASCLVNFGGDLAVTRPRADGNPWRVGIEDPDTPSPTATRLVFLTSGGLATSGDSRRFVMKDGVRYGHILDPITGWPLPDAPRSVTVAAASCVEAGMLATLAALQGGGAESFLEAQGVQFWIARPDRTW